MDSRFASLSADRGRRLLVFGSDGLTRILFRGIKFVSGLMVVCLERERRLRAEVQWNVLEEGDPDTVLIAVRDVTGETPGSLLRLEISLRKLGWAGGLVVVTTDRDLANSLRRQPLFGSITGHSVVAPPLSLPSIVFAIQEVGELWPNMWQIALGRYALAPLGRLLSQVQAALDSRDVERGRELLEQWFAALDRSALRRLLPHGTVLRDVQELRSELRIPCHRESLMLAVAKLNRLLAPFRFGE